MADSTQIEWTDSTWNPVTGCTKLAGVLDALLQAFMLRETNVKDICVELARHGKIRKIWGDGNRKPTDQTVIELVA